MRRGNQHGDGRLSVTPEAADLLRLSAGEAPSHATFSDALCRSAVFGDGFHSPHPHRDDAVRRLHPLCQGPLERRAG